MSEFKQLTLSGITWVSISQLIKQMLQFITSIVLARLLLPADFGLVAMIVVFTGFAELFGELGFGAALIQKQQVSERHLTSVFWLNVFVGLILTVLVVIAAPIIANFYNQPKLMLPTMLIAVNFLIDPLTMVQEAILNRSMQFRRLALVETVAVVIGGIIAITLALVGYGVWSLVWQKLIVSGVKTVVLWRSKGWRPNFLFDHTAIIQLTKFSSNLIGFKVFNYWVRNGDNLLVGKFMGTTALGVYTRAYAIMLLPVSQITQVLGRVMFPALSTVQNDKPRVKNIYLRSIAMIALVTFPLMLGLSVTAEHFVLTLYGPKWGNLIPLVQIFSLLGLVQSIGVTVGWIYQSQGRTDLLFRWAASTGLLVLGSIAIGVYIGTTKSVAICYAITSGILLPYPLFTIPGKLIDMTFAEVARSVAGILACAFVMAVAVWGLGLLLPNYWPHWLYLVMQTSGGAIIYGLLLRLFRIKAYNEARSLLTERLKYYRTRPAVSHESSL